MKIQCKYNHWINRNSKQFNIVLIGDPNVGKSNILGSKNKYYPTKECISKETTIRDYTLIRWDTPGNETDESFEENTAKYYKEADIPIVV